MSRTRFGLAVLGTIATFVVCLLIASRPLAAQGRPSPPRWEQWCTYKNVDLAGLSGGGPEDVANKLNPDLKAKGLQGWELAGVSIISPNGGAPQAHYCFKRPIP